MKIKRTICTILAMLSLLLLIGTVGGMDLGTYTLGRGTVQALICFAVFAISAWQAGGFKNSERRKTK